jgi:RNA-binding protein 39
MSDREDKDDKKRSRSRSRSKDRRKRDRSKERSRRRRRRSKSGSPEPRKSRSGSRSRRRRSRSRSRSPVDPAAEALRRAAAEEREANRDSYTVFVSQIHPKVDERDLFEFFSHVGRVEDIRLIRDQRTQKSKGLCYVEFHEKDSVNKAVALTNQLIGGYPISVQICQSQQHEDVPTSMKLYVGSLHYNVTEDDLKPVFEAFGSLDFIDLHKDPVTGQSKGFGFVQYKNEADARAALQALNGLEIAGRAIKVGTVDQAGAEAQSALASQEEAGQLDDLAGGGMAMTAQARAALMTKLQRGANMPGIPLPGVQSTSAGIVAAPRSNLPMIQATTCVVVKNMFDPKTETEPEFDLDIRDDVAEECTNMGAKPKHCFVDKSSLGHVYLRFSDKDAAGKVVKAFNGRWFASRQITAEFVIEATYLVRFPAAK